MESTFPIFTFHDSRSAHVHDNVVTHVCVCAWDATRPRGGGRWARGTLPPFGKVVFHSMQPPPAPASLRMRTCSFTVLYDHLIFKAQLKRHHRNFSTEVTAYVNTVKFRYLAAFTIRLVGLNIILCPHRCVFSAKCFRFVLQVSSCRRYLGAW